MKLKQRILSLALAGAMRCSLCPPALAAGEGDTATQTQVTAGAATSEDARPADGDSELPASAADDTADPAEGPGPAANGGLTGENTDPAADPAVAAVQAQLDALPTAEELAALSLDAQRAVYDQVQAAYDAYTALTADQQAQLTGAEKFDALFAVLNGMVMPLAAAGDFDVTGGTEGNDYSYSGGVLTILSSTPLTISNTNTGMATSDRIVIGSDVSANLTLAGVNIQAPADTSAIDVPSGASLTLTLLENTINNLTCNNGERYPPGIRLPAGASLAIQGNGTINVTGSSGAGAGAGIGGAWVGTTREACGTVIINGGDVNIKGGYGSSRGGAGIGGAGIGGSLAGNGGTVFINGGNVTISGGSSDYIGGVGIGGGISVSGTSGSGGTVIITGGTVLITGGDGGTESGAGGAGIGGGSSNYIGGSGGTVIILTDVTVKGGNGSNVGADIGGGFDIYDKSNNGATGQGIRPSTSSEDTYDVYGNLTLPADVTLPDNITINIPDGASMTLPEGASWPDNVTITGSGSIDPKLTATITITANLDKTHDGSAVSLDSSGYTYTGDTTTPTITITWHEDNSGTIGSALTSAPSAPGTYWVKVSAAETSRYAAAEATKRFTISAATPSITATVYKGTAPTSEFTYGDAITVSGTVSRATNNSISTQSDPAQNQVGLYLGETELATADVESDGSFALTYNTSNKGISIGENQTLTVKYGGSSDLTSGETTVNITLNKATPEAPVGPVATTSIETTSVTLLVDDPSTSPYGDIQYGYTTGEETTPGHWQVGTKFSNLQPGTDYIFYARYAGNDFYNSSPVSENSLTVTTRPEIATTSLETGYVGVYYEAKLSANVDSGKNVAWSIPTSSLPTGLQLSGNTISGTPTATGTFAFIVQASIGGGLYGNLPTDSMVTLTITINQGTPDITATTYKDGEQTSTFTYGDTITVSGTIAASATAPSASNGISLLAEPAQNQVGLYVSGNDNPIATAGVDSNGNFTLSYDTSNKGITPSETAQTLTVKYGGSSDLNSGETTVSITLNRKPVTVAFTGSTTKTYDDNASAPEGLTVALSEGTVVGDDVVTVTATSITYDDANAGTNKTITASGLTLSGNNAGWYTLSGTEATTPGTITAAQMTGTVTFDDDSAVYSTPLTATYEGNAASVTWQWYRTDRNGTTTAISGATGNTYTPTGYDVDSALYVIVTASDANHTGSVQSQPLTVERLPGSITIGCSDVTYGQTPSPYVVSNTNPEAPMWYTYTGRGDTVYAASRTPPTEAGTYSVSAYVELTVTHSAATSNTVDFTIERADLSGTLSITGKAICGETLTAVYDSSVEGETLAWQWYRDGVAIDGATANTYTLVKADAGNRISVTATATGNYTGELSATVQVEALPSGGPAPTPTATPAPAGPATAYYTCPACGFHNWTATAEGYRCDTCGHIVTAQLSGYGNVKGLYDPAAARASASGAGVTAPVPQTGDSAPITLWVVLLMASCTGMAGLLLYRKKKH